MKVTNDTNSRKVEPRLAIYLGRSNGDESPSLDSLVIAAGPTSLCYLGCLSGVCILAYCPVHEIVCIDHGQNTDGMSYAYCCAMACWFYYPFHPRVSRLILLHLLTKVNNKFQIIF